MVVKASRSAPRHTPMKQSLAQIAAIARPAKHPTRGAYALRGRRLRLLASQPMNDRRWRISGGWWPELAVFGLSSRTYCLNPENLSNATGARRELGGRVPGATQWLSRGRLKASTINRNHVDSFDGALEAANDKTILGSTLAPHAHLEPWGNPWLRGSRRVLCEMLVNLMEVDP